MTTIRKIVTSQVDGNSANADNTDEIRPFGETSFYLDTSGQDDKLVLSMFDGQRTHLRSKVVGPGVLYGSNADSGDGLGLDTIKLIPDAGLHYNDGSYGNDQYLVIDPTAPNHIHIRAGGTQDASTADLFLGGELTNVKVSDSSDSVTIRTSDASGGSAIPKEWIFDNTGKLSFPIFGAIEPVGMGWFGITNGESGGPISIVQKSVNVAHTGQYLSDITLSNSNNWTTGDARISTSNLTAGTSYQWIFGSDGTLTLPGTATIVDTADVEAAGTQILVPVNAAGDTVDYVGGASVLEVPTNAGTNLVQAGWIITFPNNTQRTVSSTGQAGGYTSIYYNEANPGLGASTYPVTIESPDFTQASAGAITLEKGEYAWGFNSDGEMILPGDGVKLSVGGNMNPSELHITLPGTGDGSGTPKLFRFTDEAGAGSIAFPDGTIQSTAARLDDLEVDGTTILTLVDEPIAIQTGYRPTISAEAISGSSQDLLVVDISEDDDIIVVGAGWEINAGSDEAPQWLPVVSTDIVPGDTYSINVPGFEFIAGFTYTFRNTEEDTYQWTFNPNGTLIGPQGSIFSNETSVMSKREYFTDKVTNYYWDGGGILYIATAGDTNSAFLLTEEIETEINQLSPANNTLTLRMTDGDGNSIVGVCSRPTSINNSFSYSQLGDVPGLEFFLDVEWTSSALPAINTLTALQRFSLDQGTYRDLNIELLEPHGQFEQRLVFRNDGSLEIPEQIQLGSMLISSTQNGLTINSGGNTWTFDINGHLNVPNEIASDQTMLGIRSNTGARLQYQDPTPTTDLGVLNQSLVTVDPSGIKLEIKSSTGSDTIGTVTGWTFDVDGAVTFPDSTVQTTAWAGGRVVSVPASSVGATGDKAGDIAFNAGYMYYCTANHTGTSTTISWSSVAEFTGVGEHIMAEIANPSQLNGILTVTNIVTNGVTSPSELVTSYALVGGSTYKFYLAVTVEPWNTLQNSTLQVVPNIWRRVAWSADTW